MHRPSTIQFRCFRTSAIALVVLGVAAFQALVAQERQDRDDKTKDNIESSAAADEEKVQRVPQILEIEYAVQQSNPPNLLITATGEVPTAGWKKIQLLRRVYITPPADGIWEYDLVGLPPTGPAAQVVTKVRGRDQWKDYDQKTKGVRVYGIGRGTKEIRFGREKGKESK